MLQAGSGEIETPYQRAVQNEDGQMSHQSTKIPILLPHLIAGHGFLTSSVLALLCLAAAAKIFTPAKS